MYKLIISFCFAFFIALTSLEAAIAPIPCAPQLQQYLSKIQKIPEAVALIEKIQKGGNFKIEVSNHGLARQFGAFWDVDNRIICVHPGFHESEGEIIGSIIFEMHNAAVSPRLDELDKIAYEGRIDREGYVREVEHIEFDNSHSAARIADRGIAMGIFPRNARLPVYPNFEEHYRMQKIGGHSAWIGRTYDQIVGGRG